MRKAGSAMRAVESLILLGCCSVTVLTSSFLLKSGPVSSMEEGDDCIDGVMPDLTI